ncbi:MAG: hypothetical protein JSU65_09000 [Candidatus Zixiibacteriota bacterium]|nr:MAG: hypothetical protein JSU65_09000 [candidate division Zixibacteria bacterium]
MKRIILLIGLSLCIWAVAGGCGDDSNPSGYRVSGPKAVLFGTVNGYSSHWDFRGSLSGTDGLIPDVDSVMFLQEPCSLYTYWDPRQGYSVQATGCVSTSPDEYASGDTLNIGVFLPSGTSTIRTKLVDRLVDSIHFQGVSDSMYVSKGTELVIRWETIPNADWYLVYYYGTFWDNSAGYTRYTREFVAPESTVVRVSGEETDHDGFWIFNVFAMTGPEFPAYSREVETRVCGGVVNSYVMRRITIFVGTGDPYDPGAASAYAGAVEHLSPEEILSEYRRR